MLNINISPYYAEEKLNLIKERGRQVFKIEKKQVKIVPIIIAVFFLLGVAGISSKTYAASSSNIGVVDFQLLMSQHPDMVAAQETMKTETEQTQKDFNDKTATMTSDQEKQAYFNQLQQHLGEQNQILLGNIRDKVIAAVKEVADTKGLTLVMDKSAAIYGGQDITVEVGKKITGK
jgi:outer membrane protein